MTMRLSHSSLTGTERTLVAVGTVSEASMFCAVRAGAPRRIVYDAWSFAGVGSAGLDSLGTGLVVPLAGSAALASGRGLATGAGVLALASSALARRARLAAWSRRAWSRRGLVSAGFAAGAFSVVEPGEPLARGRGRRGGGLRRRRGRVRPVARRRGLEVRDPDRVDALGVALVLVEHLLDQPLVGPEVAGGLAKGLVGLAARRLRHGWVRLFLRCVRMKLDPVDQVSPRHEQMPTRRPCCQARLGVTFIQGVP